MDTNLVIRRRKRISEVRLQKPASSIASHTKPSIKGEENGDNHLPELSCSDSERKGNHFRGINIG